MAPRSFKKFSIAVSGTIPGYKQGQCVPWSFLRFGPTLDPERVSSALIILTLKADVKSLVESVGATFTSTVDEDCTHLITTQKDVEKNSAKCMFTDSHPIIMHFFFLFLSKSDPLHRQESGQSSKMQHCDHRLAPGVLHYQKGCC